MRGEGRQQVVRSLIELKGGGKCGLIVEDMVGEIARLKEEIAFYRDMFAEEQHLIRLRRRQLRLSEKMKKKNDEEQINPVHSKKRADNRWGRRKHAVQGGVVLAEEGVPIAHVVVCLDAATDGNIITVISPKTKPTTSSSTTPKPGPSAALAKIRNKPLPRPTDTSAPTKPTSATTIKPGTKTLPSLPDCDRAIDNNKAAHAITANNYSRKGSRLTSSPSLSSTASSAAAADTTSPSKGQESKPTIPKPAPTPATTLTWRRGRGTTQGTSAADA